MSSTPRPIRRLIEYTARSGVSIKYLRAALPTMIFSFSSSATTDGTRFTPSSPGITTGELPCINATRELVVPRSMPTMRLVEAIQNDLKSSIPECLIHVSYQIPYVAAAVEQVHQLVANLMTARFVGRVCSRVPGIPVALQFIEQRSEFRFQGGLVLLQFC